MIVGVLNPTPSSNNTPFFLSFYLKNQHKKKPFYTNFHLLQNIHHSADMIVILHPQTGHFGTI